MAKLYLVATLDDTPRQATFDKLPATGLHVAREVLDFDAARVMDGNDWADVMDDMATILDRFREPAEPVYQPDPGKAPELPMPALEPPDPFGDDPDAWRNGV
jgi:hypothetical protein